MRGNRPYRALEQHVEHEAVVRSGDRLLIACSGGSDSVGLAAVLQSLSKRMRLHLTLAYVHHGLRRSAWQDEAVVLAVSAALGIPARVAALASGRADEATLREARYEALSRIARECGAGAVATAHNAEDQTETVLLALFRGTGPSGIGGMPPRRRLRGQVELIRPFLGVERAGIRAYVCQRALPYAIDPTNDDVRLRRNAVRRALAALRPVFPGLDAAVARAAALLTAEVTRQPRASARREVRELLARHEALRDVDFIHVAAAVRALERGRSGRFHMGPGVELRIEGGIMTVHREKP